MELDSTPNLSRNPRNVLCRNELICPATLNSLNYRKSLRINEKIYLGVSIK
jgi:hypothetical protein